MAADGDMEPGHLEPGHVGSGWVGSGRVGSGWASLLGRTAPVLAPLGVIALARLAGRTALAEAHPRLAAILFTWIAAEALTLALLARDKAAARQLRLVVGRLAAAALVVLLAAPPAVREGLRALPALQTALLLTLVLHALWTLLGVLRGLGSARPGTRGQTVLAAIVPAPLLSFAMSEARFLRMTLFSWNAAPDVPPGTHAFAYHRHLAPMMGVLLAIQFIEIGATELLLRLWSPTTAHVFLALGMAGALYTVGLIKSLRLKPVLIEDDALLVRMGTLPECRVPLARIAGLAEAVDGAEVRASSTRNMALLAWPNIVIRLKEPLPRASLLKRREPSRAIALHLDEPETFRAALAEALAKAPERARDTHR